MISKKLLTLTLIGFGCTTLISAIVEITPSYTGKDEESFEIGSNAKLTCTINPYSGSQAWKVNSVSVADCGFVLCSENSSNPGRYSFMPSISTGTFNFTISDVKNADNETVIECFGGSITDTDRFTIIVTVPPTCDRNDYFACGALAVAEFVYVIVLVQYLYGSLHMYELLKRVEPEKNVRYIWSLFCVWIPVVGFFVSCCTGKKALKGKKECYQCGNPKIQGYCYDCKTYLNLCIECYAKHYSPHIKRQFPVKGKAECQKCKSKEKVTEFCLNCEGYICIHCYQSHGKDCKTVDNEKGVHECTDCKKENTGNIYCIKCEVYLCKSCSEGHYVRIEHSGVNINVIGEKKDCSDCILIKAQGHCLTCNLFLCEQCFNRHYQTDKHLKRRKKVKKQTLLFKICTVIFGCIFVIGQTLFFLPACLEDCKRSVLPEWHKITLSIKYVVVSLVAVIAVLVFIKLLEDCFYCDDCECKSVADGYCVDCRQYLCNKCVEKHKTKHPPQSVILQHARNQEYVDACRGLKVQYFCLKCKTYFKKDTLLDHMTRLHPEDNDPDFTHINVQYNPMDSQQIHHNRQKSKELLEMHAGSSTERNDFVCGICSKKKYGTKTSYIICALCFKKQSGGNGDECNQKCKICPDNNMRNVNVHCLVCKESMCMTCFEWHKQLYQTWKEPHRQQEKDVRTSSEKSVPSGVVARITAGPLLVGEIIYLIYKYCRKGSKVEPREDQT